METGKPGRGMERAFTLVELILAIAIISAVLVAAFSLLLFNNQIFRRGSNLSNLQSELRLSADYIVREVRNATEITLSTPSVPTDYNRIYVDANTLMCMPAGGTAAAKTGSVFPNPASDVKFTLSKSGTSYMLKFTLHGTRGDATYDIDNLVILNNITAATLLADKQAIYYKKAN